MADLEPATPVDAVPTTQSVQPVSLVPVVKPMGARLLLHKEESPPNTYVQQYPRTIGCLQHCDPGDPQHQGTAVYLPELS